MEFPQAEYNVVTFWHSLEHLQEPLQNLKKVRRSLKPGGIVIIEVPNVDSLEKRLFKSYWALWDVPRHLYHFSPDSLAKMCIQAGFKVEKILFLIDIYDFPRSIQNLLPWEKAKVLFDSDRMRYITKYLFFRRHSF